MSITLRPFTATALLVGAVITLAAPPATAQDVQYRSVTKVDLGGAMNAMMRLAGGNETVETVYIKGKKLRSENDKQAIIFDLDNSRYTVINKEDRTYMSVPIAEMATVATSAVRGMQANASRDTLRGTAVDSAGNKADFTVDIKVDPTGKRQNINGNDAEQVLVSMETDVRVTPQGSTQSEQAGTLVILMDTWNANTGPASDAVKAWEQAASKEIAAAAFGSRANMGPAMAANPGMAEAMQKAQEEAQKVDGIAVRSTMHLVIVAAGQKFNRELALGEAGGGGAASGGERRGGWRGMIGRAVEAKTQQKQEQPTEQQTQGTLAKVTTEIRDVRSTAVDPSLFQVPAGFREVKPEPVR